MHTVDEILNALTDVEKAWLYALYVNDAPLKMRVQFINTVLVGRLGWSISGWDIMTYNQKLIIVCNRLVPK